VTAPSFQECAGTDIPETDDVVGTGTHNQWLSFVEIKVRNTSLAIVSGEGGKSGGNKHTS